MKRTEMTFEFVEFVSKDLEEGKLYISTEYATAVHRCCCGCGSKVTTPLAPDEWRLIFDGKTVSLEPSIGNWSFRCLSHYWIRRNKIAWSGPMSKAQIGSVRRGRAPAGEPVYANTNAHDIALREGFWSRIRTAIRIGSR